MATILPCCLACGCDSLRLSLDLGSQPLANAFKEKAEEVQEEYPLAVNLCIECHHLQLTHAIEPDLMFKHYLCAWAKTIYRNISFVIEIYHNPLKNTK